MISAVGQTRDITYGEMLAMAWQPTTLFYILLVLVALTVMDVNGYQDRVGVIGSAFVWAAGVAAATASYNVAIFLWTLVNRAFGLRALPMPGIGFLSTFSTLMVVEGTVAILTREPLDWGRWLELFPYLFLVIMVFDVLYIAFAMPVIRAATATRTKVAARALPAAEEVQLAGQVFRTRSLRWATSQDHYLKIASADGSHMVLARMADLAAQTGPETGIQPHRSWWVSARAGARLEKSGRSIALVLDDGTRVPVARSRADEVKAWLDAQNA